MDFTAVADVLVAEISGVVADLNPHDVQLVVHEELELGHPREGVLGLGLGVDQPRHHVARMHLFSCFTFMFYLLCSGFQNFRVWFFFYDFFLCVCSFAPMFVCVFVCLFVCEILGFGFGFYFFLLWVLCSVFWVQDLGLRVWGIVLRVWCVRRGS